MNKNLQNHLDIIKDIVNRTETTNSSLTTEELNKLIDKNGLALLGPLTIQFFKKSNGDVYLLEINPRFGGGVPLSFEAGADYGHKIHEMLEGKPLEYIKDFKEIIMLRYEEAVFDSVNS